MKVVCVATQGTTQPYDYKRSLTVGKEYLVIGLDFDVHQDSSQPGGNVYVIPDVGLLVSFPLELFRISDVRISSLWEIDYETPARMSLGHPTLLPSGYAIIDTVLEEDDPTVHAQYQQALEDFLKEFLPER